MERKGPEVVARESDRPGNFLGFISTALWLPREEQPAIVLGIVYVRLCLFLQRICNVYVYDPSGYAEGRSSAGFR